MIQFSDVAADSQPVTDDVVDLALTDDSLNLTLVKTEKSAVGGYLGRTTMTLLRLVTFKSSHSFIF